MPLRHVRVLWVTLYFAVVGPFVGSLVVSASMLAAHWMNGTSIAMPPMAGEWPISSAIFLFVAMSVFGVAAGVIPAGLVGLTYAIVFYSRPHSHPGIVTKALVAGSLGLIAGLLFSRTFPTTPGFTVAGCVAGIVCSIVARVPGRAKHSNAE